MRHKVKWLKGVVVSLLTPFDGDENVDEKRMRGLVDFLIEKGVNCLFPLSSTGEFYKQSLEERKRVIDITIDQANSRVPVLPGCHTLSTKLSIELAQHAKNTGADAVVLLHPYGSFRLSEDLLFKHYQAVSEAVDIPIAVYTEEGFTNDMSIELIDRIADLDNVIGIKLSTANMARFQRGVQQFGKKIAILTGIETVYVTTLSLGGVGGFLGTANMIPEYWVKTYDLFTKGLIKEAQEMQKKFVHMAHALIRKYGYSETVKEALNIRGVPVGRTRRPSRPITAEARRDISNFLTKLGISLET